MRTENKDITSTRKFRAGVGISAIGVVLGFAETGRQSISSHDLAKRMGADRAQATVTFFRGHEETLGRSGRLSEVGQPVAEAYRALDAFDQANRELPGINPNILTLGVWTNMGVLSMASLLYASRRQREK